MAEPFEARVGSTLCGKWTLERLLGVGGMAAVYAARHRVGHPVAIKILHPDLARSSDLRARFEQEAHAMGKINHPGAVEVRDIDVSEDGAPFIVMELLEGESLKERLMRGAVPVPELLRFVDEALDILAAAHAQGIVHRDIKLDNLFIQTSGSIKLLDFGIARVREGVAKTAVGMRLGTLPYMPPEQVRGDQVDGRADLFALGAVMFRALAGRRLHDVKTESEMIIAMSSRPAPALETVAPELPHGVCVVVDCALAFERARRYPDATTMQEDIVALRSQREPPHARALLDAHGPPNAMPSMPPTVRPGASQLEPGVASATAAATPFAAEPVAEAGGALAMPKTALIPQMHASASAEATKVSAGVANATMVSEGVVAAAAAMDAPQAALGPSGTIVAPPSSAMAAAAAGAPRKNHLVVPVIASSVVALIIVVALAIWAAGGDETASEQVDVMTKNGDDLGDESAGTPTSSVPTSLTGPPPDRPEPVVPPGPKDSPFEDKPFEPPGQKKKKKRKGDD